MKLSKGALRKRREDLLCPEGEHTATLAGVRLTAQLPERAALG